MIENKLEAMRNAMTYERTVGYGLAALAAVALMQGSPLGAALALTTAILIYTRPVVEDYAHS